MKALAIVGVSAAQASNSRGKALDLIDGAPGLSAILSARHCRRARALSHWPVFVPLGAALLLATTLLPYAIRMSGVLYLVSALVLGAIFIAYAWRLYRNYSDALSRALFRYSIVYLTALFAALLLDKYLGG